MHYTIDSNSSLNPIVFITFGDAGTRLILFAPGSIVPEDPKVLDRLAGGIKAQNRAINHNIPLAENSHQRGAIFISDFSSLKIGFYVPNLEHQILTGDVL